MTLYKYVPPERIDILANKQIRFTQPGLFNDPFESLPHVRSLGADEAVFAAISEANRQPDRSKFATLPEEVRADITFEEFVALVRENQERGLAQFRAQEPDALPEQRTRLYDTVNNAVGVLSLVERPDNLLMWAHYSRDHKGFVIGFNSNHQFFHPERDDDELLKLLARVTYSTTRPSITLAGVTVEELLLRKGRDWEYEREWRFLRYLQDATKTIIVDGHDCCLFELPGQCIKEVVFGCRMSEKRRDDLLGILRSDPDLRSIRIYQSMIDSVDYRLRFDEVTL